MNAVKSKKKTYDLNTQSDPFFGKYASVPFPEAVEANEKELAEVDHFIYDLLRFEYSIDFIRCLKRKQTFDRSRACMESPRRA